MMQTFKKCANNLEARCMRTGQGFFIKNKENFLMEMPVFFIGGVNMP